MSPVLPSSKAAALLIFGAGGHGRVVADAAIAAGLWNSIVATDDNPALCDGSLLADISVLKADETWMLRGTLALHIAIGNNLHRERAAARWGHDRLVSIAHPAALVSRFASMGAGCFVAAGAVLAPGARLDQGIIVNHCAVVDHDVQIGAFSHVAPHATLGGDVSVGQRVLVGAGAVVLPGMVVADDITVGAGAVVRCNLAEPGIYAGVPARRIR